MNAIRSSNSTGESVSFFSRNGTAIGDLKWNGSSAAVRNSSGEIVGRLELDGGRVNLLDKFGKRVGYTETTTNGEIVHHSLDQTGLSTVVGRQAVVLLQSFRNLRMASGAGSGNSGSIAITMGLNAEAAMNIPPFEVVDTPKSPGGESKEHGAEAFTIDGANFNGLELADTAFGRISDLCFSRNGSLLYACMENGDVVTWNTDTGSLIRRATLKGSKLSEGKFTAEGNFLIGKFETPDGFEAGIWSTEELSAMPEL